VLTNEYLKSIMQFMNKECQICKYKFNTKSHSRLYCYDCSPISTREVEGARKHHKTILRRKMKEKAIDF